MDEPTTDNLFSQSTLLESHSNKFRAKDKRLCLFRFQMYTDSLFDSGVRWRIIELISISSRVHDLLLSLCVDRERRGRFQHFIRMSPASQEGMITRLPRRMACRGSIKTHEEWGEPVPFLPPSFYFCVPQVDDLGENLLFIQPLSSFS